MTDVDETPDGPEFTVVIPTYDRPDLLAEAVASVVAQTVDDWECLIVDDAGSIGVHPFADPRVRIVRREVNGGAAAALNTGARLASGRYLTILADDDLWTPRRLEIAREGLRRAPLALCAARFIDQETGEIEDGPNGHVADTILDGLPPSMGTVAIERARWLDVREDYRTVEDVEWWLRTAEQCDVASVAEVGYLVRSHAGVRHLSGSDARLRDNLRFMSEYADWLNRHPRAKAFRLRRVAYFASLCGERKTAIRALAASMKLRPSLRTFKQLVLAACGRPRADS